MAADPQLVIRRAKTDDVPLLLDLIRELAVYERLEKEVIASEEDLLEALFGPRPTAEALIAELGGEAAGFALFFHNYSTFVGRPGLYLEDLYVREVFRGNGIGKALLIYLARLACQRRCGRMEWAVLDWNEPAIRFYKALDAVALDEWTVYRLRGEALTRLAEQAFPESLGDPHMEEIP